jgi:hypothetical protein
MKPKRKKYRKAWMAGYAQGWKDRCDFHHGRDCPKAEHEAHHRYGHSPVHDGPYYLGHDRFCGRCHQRL